MVDHKEINDDVLIKRVVAGDHKAFEVLMRKYQHRVGYVLSRYSSNHHEIEDMTQEVFIRAYRALPKFKGESALFTWLYKIATNLAKNQLAYNSRRKEITANSHDDDSFEEQFSAHMKHDEKPEDIISGRELKDALLAALESMPDDMAQAIKLRELEGLSYEEIAVKMQCPIGTVRSRIFRGREVLDHVILENRESTG